MGRKKRRKPLFGVRDIPEKKSSPPPPQFIQVQLPANLTSPPARKTAPKKKTSAYKRGKYKKTTSKKQKLKGALPKITKEAAKRPEVEFKRERVRKQVTIPSPWTALGRGGSLALGGGVKTTKVGYKYIAKPLGKGAKSYGKTRYSERTKFGLGGKKGTVQIKKITAEKEEAKARKEVQEYKAAQRQASKDRRENARQESGYYEKRQEKDDKRQKRWKDMI